MSPDGSNNTSETSKKYRISIIEYLCRKNMLTRLKERISYVSSQGDSDIRAESFSHIVRLTVPIDVIMLADISGELVEDLYWDPYRIETEFRSILSGLCRDEVTLDMSLLISSLPTLPQITSSTLYNEDRSLFIFPAIVSALSNIVKYVRSKVYRCDGCKTEVVVKEGRSDRNCRSCGSSLTEVRPRRQSGDRLLARLLPRSALTSTSRHQAVTLYFTEELCYGLELGITYNLVLSRDLRVWGYEPLLPNPFRVLPRFTRSINNFIGYISQKFGDSPLALVTALAVQLDGGVYPPAAFLHLKTALLLSIASLGMYEGGVAVLALGDTSKLIASVLDSCPRLLRPTLFHPQKTTFAQGSYTWKEAGPLLLSSQSVYCVGDISRVHSSYVSHILKAVDNEVVSQMGKDEQVKLPLRASVWAHWNCDKHSINDVTRLKTIINIFGVPFMGESYVEEDELASYILTKAVDPNLKFDYLLPREDIRAYLETVSVQQVEMSTLASTLIQNYFVASRRERPDSLPVRSIKIMTRLAESSARLSQRRIVTHEDALLAAFLYEETLLALFGSSVYSPPLDRCLKATDSLIDILTKMDHVFMKFSLWLDHYVKTLTCSTSNYSLI